jgi:hypothetical protein
VRQTKDVHLLDASGHLLAWLFSRVSIYAIGVKSRIDIGSLETYIDAVQVLDQRRKLRDAEQKELVGSHVQGKLEQDVDVKIASVSASKVEAVEVAKTVTMQSK